VAAVEPDRVRTIVGTPDPLAVDQPFLRLTHWTPPAPGGRRPLVAVLDTGIDVTVPDLGGRVITGAARSFVPGSSPLQDQSGHGTHVAGIIAAAAENGLGVAGVADARLLVVKIADREGRATTASLVRGIHYALSRRARVINLSLSGLGSSPLEQQAVDDAARAGALVVAAAGNSGRSGSPREYPGAYRHVLAVAATDDDQKAIPTSTRGPQVAISAPGKRILSTAPGRGGPPRYVSRTGTSMASAIVTGVAARLLARNPRLDGSQLREMLLGSAMDLGPRGDDRATGWGLVSLAGALEAPVPPRDRPEPDDDPADVAAAPPLLDVAGPPVASIEGSVEHWADPSDDVRVVLQAGETLDATLQGDPATDMDLVLWRPGAPSFVPGPAYVRQWLAAAEISPRSFERMVYTANQPGAYTLEVQAASGRGRYRLTLRRQTPAA
jgi:subtilisin family serine protease